MKQELFTLPEIAKQVGTWYPIKIRKSPSALYQGNFGLGGYSYKIGDSIEVVKNQAGNLYFALGGYIGITSTIGLEKSWEIVDCNIKIETKQEPKLLMKPFTLTPEQEAMLKEKAIAAQMLCIENDVRLAIFSRTLESVKEEQVEEIISLVYNKKAKDTFTKKQLDNAISKTVESKYAEQTI